MQIWSKNSKKCSALRLVLFLPLGLLAASSSWAAVPQNGKSLQVVEQELRSDLSRGRRPQFETLLQVWEQKYGTGAVPTLVKIAADRKLEDTSRYVAIMGAAKLGGSAIAPELTPMLKDKSWMVRTASLRALSALRNPKTAASTLPLLKDPALLVRAEAIEAVMALRPPGSLPALISTLKAGHNYHKGKAQMVPQRALDAIAKLGARESAPELAPLLGHDQDPVIQERVIKTLESLTGKKLVAQASLGARVKAWKKELSSLR